VPKKDSSLRLVVDFRALNERSVKQPYTLPRIDDLLASFGQAKAKFFSTLDLARGYWQIPLHPESQRLTAFTSEFGTFQFSVMPFGLAGAPATFQAMMDRLLWTMHGSRPYLDDVPIHTSSWGRHVEELRRTFAILRTANLKLKPTKCHLFRRSVVFLGHRVSSAGVEPDPAKVQSIRAIPSPKTAKALRRFLGMIGFYRRFIPQCAGACVRLHALLKKGAKFVWGPEENNSFEELKNKLANRTTLQYPRFDAGQPFVVKTDASSAALGAVLEQNDAPLEFYSRTLSETERRYTILEQEALAVIEALRHWRHYLLGKEFVLKTDSEPLKFILARDRATGRSAAKLTRWALTLAEFDFKAEHVKGKDNPVADCLSRDTPDTCPTNRSNVCMVVRAAPTPQVCVATSGATLPNVDAKAAEADPNSLPLDLAVLHHGHASHREMVRRARRRGILRRGLAKKCKEYVRSCLACQAAEGSLRPHQALFATWAPPSPFNTWAIDLVGPLPTDGGHKFLLTAIDLATRWAEAIPLKSTTTTAVVTALMDTVICRYGLPQRLLSDRGTQFTSKVFDELLKRLGVRQVLTTSFHPQTNGALERLHRTLKTQLRRRLFPSEKNWVRLVQPTMLTIRTTFHKALKTTPFEVVFGQAARLPIDAMMSTEPIKAGHVRAIHEGFRQAHQHDLDYKQATKCSVDQRRSPVSLEAGDLVLLKRQPASTLETRFKGPYRVLEDASGRDPRPVRIQHLQSGTMERVHMERLKPFVPLRDSVPRESGDVEGGDGPRDRADRGVETFKVDSIVAHKKVGRDFKWLIKWQGYPESDNSWEPSDNVPSRAVAKYLMSLPTSSTQPSSSSRLPSRSPTIADE